MIEHSKINLYERRTAVRLYDKKRYDTHAQKSKAFNIPKPLNLSYFEPFHLKRND